MRHMPKTHYAGLMGIVVVSLVGSVLYIALKLMEEPPVTFTNEPFPLYEERVYEAGDAIAFVRHRCAMRPVEYTLTQTFVLETPSADRRHSVAIESQKVSVPKAGCEDVTPIERKIPEFLPSGTYHMEFGVLVSGTFRDFSIVQRSAPFQVVNEELDQKAEESNIPPRPEAEIRYVEPPMQTIYVPVIQKEKETVRETHIETVREPEEVGDTDEESEPPSQDEKEEQPSILQTIRDILI